MMSRSERRLHVYQNGLRSVVTLSESRLCSTSLDGASLHLSHDTSNIATATTLSPLHYRTHDHNCELAPRLDNVVEDAVTSPLPRAPTGYREDSRGEEGSGVGKAAYRKYHATNVSPSTLYHTASSLQGVSHSRDIGPSHVSSSSCWSHAAPSSPPDVALQPHSAVDASTAAAHGSNHPVNTEHDVALCVALPAPTTPLMDSCDVSRITSSPAEHAAIEQHFHATFHPSGQADHNKSDVPQKKHISAEKAGEWCVSQSTPVCQKGQRRSGEATLAERVLFQGDEEEYETEREDENGDAAAAREQRCNGDDGGGSSGHESSVPSTLMQDNASQLLLDGAPPLFPNSLLAHTPPGLDPPPKRSSKKDAGELEKVNHSSSSGDDREGSTLSYTRVPGELSSIHDDGEALKRNFAPHAVAAHQPVIRERTTARDSCAKEAAETCPIVCEAATTTTLPAAAKVLPTDFDAPFAASADDRMCTPTVNRGELLRHLLQQAASATLHTPRTGSLSSVSGAAASPPLSTTPHPAVRRFSASTPSWEGLAQITGFPTPVKLSPIPTKAYTRYTDFMATPGTCGDAGAAGGESPVLLASPALSAIAVEEEHFEAAGSSTPLHGGVALAKVDEVEKEGERQLDTADAVDERIAASPTTATATHYDFLEQNAPAPQPPLPSPPAQGPTNCSATSECSVSPIRARAGQTTRVWTPHPSDISQPSVPPQPLQATTTMSCITSAYDNATQLGVTFSLANSHVCGTSVSVERAGVVDDGLNAARQGALSASRVEASPTTGTVAAALPSHDSQLLSRPPSSRWSAVSFDLPQCETATLQRSADALKIGQCSPRVVVTDTLNLGTPTVSVIHSPAQAFNESCSFLLPPAVSQYLHALPVPGMRSTAPRSVAATEPSPQLAAARTSLSANSTIDVTPGDEMMVSVCQKQVVPHPQVCSRRRMPLLSPTFGDDSEEEDGVRVAEGLCCTLDKEQTVSQSMVALPGVVACQLASEIDTAGAFAAPLRVHRGTQTSIAGVNTSLLVQRSSPSPTKSRESLRHKAKTSLVSTPPSKKRAVAKGLAAAPMWSSLESPPLATAHSSISTAASCRYQRFGLSSVMDGAWRGEQSRLEGHRSGALKSLSSTRIIDTWL